VPKGRRAPDLAQLMKPFPAEWGKQRELGRARLLARDEQRSGKLDSTGAKKAPVEPERTLSDDALKE
jgi:hypothetical protein